MTTPVAPTTALEWQQLSLSQVSPLVDALATMKTTVEVAQRGLAAAQAALEVVSLNSLAVGANDALRAIANGVLQAFADVLQAPGVYAVTCYPRRVDYNRALVGEKLSAARARAEAQRAALATLSRRVPRTATEERLVATERARAEAALQDAEAAIRRWARADKLCASDLLTAFPFEAWLAQFEDTLTDSGDARRPLFSRESIVTGVAVLVGADAVADLPPLLRTLGEWANDKRLRRAAEALTRLASSDFERLQGSAATPPRPPDWRSLSLAGALGIEAQIALLRRGVAGLSLPTVASSSGAAKALRTVALMKAGLQDVLDGLQTVLQTVGALQSLASTGGAVLLVPPVQGERVVQLSDGPRALPVYTRGVQGFVETLRASRGAPKQRWCVGAVLLAGAPVLLDGSTIVEDLALAPGVAAARGQAELAYRFLRGPW